MIIPQISINSIINEDNAQNPIQTVQKIKNQLQQPPIIIHTGPTPQQTPSNSLCNSPLQYQKFTHKEKYSKQNTLRRTLSLDSASDKIKVFKTS
jgi:hypothetical protein